jgi:dynein intermediate chain 3, axonemal
MVNFSGQYDPKDFVDKNKEGEMKEELFKSIDTFFDVVAPRVESALQSNELINVFQDDFECLGEKLEGNSKSVMIMSDNNEALPYVDTDHQRNKMASCICFHPQHPYLCAVSYIYNLDFNKRCEIMGKSSLNSSTILILNFQDSAIITLQRVLETPIEITKISFHPQKPDLLFGGSISGQVAMWDMTDEHTKIV